MHPLTHIHSRNHFTHTTFYFVLRRNDYHTNKYHLVDQWTSEPEFMIIVDPEQEIQEGWRMATYEDVVQWKEIVKNLDSLAAWSVIQLKNGHTSGSGLGYETTREIKGSRKLFIKIDK